MLANKKEVINKVASYVAAGSEVLDGINSLQLIQADKADSGNLLLKSGKQYTPYKNESYEKYVF